MKCPLCNQPGTLVNKVRKVTTAAGIGAGGYLAVSGSTTGAASVDRVGLRIKVQRRGQRAAAQEHYSGAPVRTNA